MLAAPFPLLSLLLGIAFTAAWRPGACLFVRGVLRRRVEDQARGCGWLAAACGLLSAAFLSEEGWVPAALAAFLAALCAAAWRRERKRGAGR